MHIHLHRARCAAPLHSALCARTTPHRPPCVKMVQCACCGKREEELGEGLMRCTRCHSASYCDGECQKAHWSAHRGDCKAATTTSAVISCGTYSCRTKQEGVKGVHCKTCHKWFCNKSCMDGDKTHKKKTCGSPPESEHAEHAAVHSMEPSATTLRPRANAGDAVAMTQLGYCYEHGAGGVGENVAQAVHWYTQATEARDPPAEAYFHLGNCFYFPTGVQKNLPKAVQLFRVAAEMGHSPSQHNLGVCLQRGEGVQSDLVEAFTWFKRAADVGDADAICSVGYALLYGEGVQEDKPAAIAYYRYAAHKGNASAMYNLGACYKEGDGVMQDVAQAVAWYTRARVAGDSDAETALHEITLTPAQRAEVDQLLAAPVPPPPLPTAAGVGGGAGAPPPPAPTS